MKSPISVLINIIGVSLTLMLLFTQPRDVYWGDYTSTWSRVMGASGLVGMVIIVRQVMLGMRGLFARWIYNNNNSINKIHQWLSAGAIIALFFHPLAALVAYGSSRMYLLHIDISSSYALGVSLGKVGLQLLIVSGVIIYASKHIRSYQLPNSIYLLLYPAYIAIWVHAWMSGSMIANSAALQAYRLFLGMLLIASSCYKLYMHFNSSGSTQADIIHFVPLSS